MGRLKLRRIAAPAVLRRIAYDNLVALLRSTARDFLLARKLDLDVAAEAFDYERLATVLATPDTDFPPDLADTLHHVAEMADAHGMDQLLEVGRPHLADLVDDASASPADVAVRLWLRDRPAFERALAERMVARSKRFESYAGKGGNEPATDRGLLTCLEQELAAWFTSKNRSAYVRVSVIPHRCGIWFLVRHGHAIDRRGVLRDGKPTSAVERPEVYDIVEWDEPTDELRVHTASKGERELYRMAFGLHVFGDADRFPAFARYTLAPLKKQGEDVLACEDVEGIEEVSLREIRYHFKGEAEETVIRRSSQDLFRALHKSGTQLDKLPLVSASFLITFSGGIKPRTITVRPPCTLVFERENEEVIHAWLKARGFLGTAGGSA